MDKGTDRIRTNMYVDTVDKHWEKERFHRDMENMDTIGKWEMVETGKKTLRGYGSRPVNGALNGTGICRAN